ncbi:MAG TPA: hypothetical protein VK835_09765 [Bacteroidia bacterium]|jgi:hypothetical protein|nr:hypothetical protein [Bacteroidia bacterium]
MKLSNIFKKADKTTAKANVEKLEKKQLEKVIGGSGTDDTTTVDDGSTDRVTRTRAGNKQIVSM